MLDRREKNAVIFKDTEYMYRTNNELMTAVEQSKYKQKLILEDDIIDLVVEKSKLGKVMVSGKRTLEASELYAKQGKKVKLRKILILPLAPSVSCADSSLPEGASSYTFRLKISDTDTSKMLRVSASLREGGGIPKG